MESRYPEVLASAAAVPASTCQYLRRLAMPSQAWRRLQFCVRYLELDLMWGWAVLPPVAARRNRHCSPIPTMSSQRATAGHIQLQ